MADIDDFETSLPEDDYGEVQAPAVEQSDEGLQPAKPLQVFLLCAFVVTALAYLADLRSQPTHDYALESKESKLRHLVQNQDNYLSHSKYGFQAMDRKHYDLAAYHFRMALLSQNTAEGHYNLATAFLRQDKLDAACAQFKAALYLNPKSTAVYKAWGQALLSQGKPDEAARVYQDGLQQTPKDPVLHFSLAAALEAHHKNTQAAAEYTEAARLGLATTNSRYLDTLARSYAADGDFAQAIVWENKAIHQARQLNQQDLLKEFGARCALYQQQKTQ